MHMMMMTREDIELIRLHTRQLALRTNITVLLVSWKKNKIKIDLLIRYEILSFMVCVVVLVRFRMEKSQISI